jgi:hypothetical protein
MVALPADVVRRYRRFTLYNSPYAAHDHGHAIDLYPESVVGRSPVSGVVRETRTVRAPPKPYADAHEHLILVDVDGPSSLFAAHDELVARILHVEPAVEPGDRVAVGDVLGPTVRSGFFAPWVDDHVHLGFRRPDQNLYRAGGSLPVSVDVSVTPLPWDGTGRVAAVGETYVVLDAPAHPDPGGSFAGIASDEGHVLDGGLVHYAGGGVLGTNRGPVSLLGTPVGTATDRDLAWHDVAVEANGERVTGLSLFAARDADFGAKLVCPGHDFHVGDAVEVRVRPTNDPVHLGRR